MNPYVVLERKRFGAALREQEVRAAVQGSVDGSWTDAQLAALLMAIHFC